MVYRQTHASEGQARGIAVAIGTNTEIGLIAKRLAQVFDFFVFFTFLS